MLYRNPLQMFALALLLTLATIPLVHAGDDDDEEYRGSATNATWQAECSTCHVAYPARLLPAQSWRALMAGLDKHFGSDASLDAPAAREITAFLVGHAGKGRDASGNLRITETRWFRHEHDEVKDRVWKNPKVKSPANCAACHTGAERGNYNEHDIRIPR
jgi:mono/diheme cytochrome c family protein